MRTPTPSATTRVADWDGSGSNLAPPRVGGARSEVAGTEERVGHVVAPVRRRERAGRAARSHLDGRDAADDVHVHGQAPGRQAHDAVARHDDGSAVVGHGGQRLPGAWARGEPSGANDATRPPDLHAACEREPAREARASSQGHEPPPDSRLDEPHVLRARSRPAHRQARSLHVASMRTPRRQRGGGELPHAAPDGASASGDARPAGQPAGRRGAAGRRQPARSRDRAGPGRRQARRPPQPARARHRRELLLRHGRPLRERRHGQRPRRPAARQGRGDVGPRPDRQGLVPRRRPQGPEGPHRLHPGPRHDRDLADAELQEQGRAGQRRLPVGRLPRLLDHGLHPDRPASRLQRRPARARRRRPRARDEGLLRHHHEPHRRRHHVRRGRRPRLHLQGRGALQDGRRHAVRRPRLRRNEQLPSARPDGELPVHTGQPARRADPRQPEPQGSRVAQRRDRLPQPRQHDVHRRERVLRRLLRPRRPLHRAAARRRRDDRHLQHVDPRLPHRRLPDRHDEARRRRVLAALRTGDRADRALGRQGRVLRLRRGLRPDQAVHVALHDAGQRPGRARLPLPARRAGLRRALEARVRARRLLPRRRLVHRRRLERLPAADVPR